MALFQPGSPAALRHAQTQAMFRAAEQKFNQAYPQLQAYKQQHGGSWEDAYKAVTGEDWPKGTGVTIDKQGAHVAVDQSFMDKYGAYIGYGALAAGGIAAAAGVGAAAGAGSAAAPATAGGYYGPIEGSAAGSVLTQAPDVVAAGTGATELGPSTAANIAGTSAAEQAPAGLAGEGAPSALADAANGIPPPTIGKTNWLAPLLQGALPTIGTIVGTKIAADANTKAAQAQSDTAAKALDFEKQTYADLVGRLTPYIDSGNSAVDRENAAFGIKPPTSGLAQPPGGGVGPKIPTSGPAMPGGTPNTSVPQSASHNFVQLKSPDGAIHNVPDYQVDYFLSKGATRVPAETSA